MRVFEYKGNGSINFWKPKVIKPKKKEHQVLKIGAFKKGYHQYVINIHDNDVDLTISPEELTGEYILSKVAPVDKEVKDVCGNICYYLSEVAGSIPEKTCMLGLTLTSNLVKDYNVLDDDGLERLGVFTHRVNGEPKILYVYIFREGQTLEIELINKKVTKIETIKMVNNKLIIEE